jgi:hypothetical protein
MFIVYIVALTFIVILLCCAVGLHFSFGLHRETMARLKGSSSPHVERTRLHDYIFSKY